MLRLQRRQWPLVLSAAALLGTLLLALPAAGAEKGRTVIGGVRLAHMSQVLAARYWAAHPELAPTGLGERLQQVTEAASGQAASLSLGQFLFAKPPVFNKDVFGLPQNEESVSACQSNPNIVLGGTNDFRGILDEQGNFTGWHFSNDGGRTLTNEGLLPAVPLLSDSETEIPSGGDPVDVVGNGCALYAASLAFDPVDPFSNRNGIAVYKSDPATLASCETEFPGNSNPACWPVRRLVAEGVGVAEPTEAAPGHFLDKEWMDVGVSGAAGEVVWVTYSDFALTGPEELDFTAEIFALRCTNDLVSCTSPIPISSDTDVQFSDVTIGPDGRVYVTWAKIEGELEEAPQIFTIKIRVAEPGSTVFGPEHTVFREELPIPFGGLLHANDLRIATYPKNDVAMVGGKPRVFVVWDACRFRPLDTICEEPEIKLVFSDDRGATWSDVIVLSQGGDNYFPSIASNDAASPTLAFTWFTNRRDLQFHNRQDVEFLAFDPATLRARARQLITGSPIPVLSSGNEPEADPILGGFFIGDYIEVAAVGDVGYVHYNANYRQVQLLEPLGVEGVPVPQQDNYLERVRLRSGFALP